MKLIVFRVSSSQSQFRASSLCFVNGGSSSILRPTSSLFSPPTAIAFNSRAFSVCGFCRMIHLNKMATNSTGILAMCKSCATRFYGTHQKSVAVTRKCRGRSLRTVSTCTSELISHTDSLIASSVVLASHLTQSDTPQRSEEWFALRRDKLTTSTFSTALGFWKGNRRFELWHEKVFTPETSPAAEGAKKFAMDWGVLNEAAAIDQYKSITGREVNSLGFAIHAEERFGWLGASPDGLLSCLQEGGGILEVKCPYNKGKPEMGLPWTKMPFYYMPQVQGQMEIMDRDWLDLYCWTPNGSTIFRVCRDRSYWQLMHGILREFWWENVVPAREALSLGREEEAKSYKPTSTHKLTGVATFKSIKLAGEAKLLCREIAGHVEFYGS